MQQQQYERLQRIKAVEREFSVVQLSIERLLLQSEQDPRQLPPTWRLRDVRMTSEKLEGTYVIRLFAEFETTLRSCWTTTRGTEPPGRARDLLDGTAANRKIPFDTLSEAHSVREFRNHLVHERDEPGTIISIQAARRRICRYLSFLPATW